MSPASKMLVQVFRCFILLITFCYKCTVATSVSQTYEPFTLLQPSNLIGLFSFDGDDNNLIPINKETGTTRCVGNLLTMDN
jgi:hypothetical protein